MHEREWNEAIGGWFFRPAMAGRPVYLSVDDETLSAIAAEQGWALEDASGDFVAALRTHVSPNSTNLLGPWKASTQRWLQREAARRAQPPPFLAILGGTVLAATRMGAVRQAAGLASYYRPLRALLGMNPISEMPPGYEDIPYFWSVLRRWLEEEMSGAVGLPTAEAPPNYWPNIGYSVSQAILRGYDRARLTDFFLAIGAAPGVALEPRELLVRLREWARAGGRISDRFRQLLESADLGEHIGRVLVRELASWDGSRRDEAGRRVLRIALTLDAKRGALSPAAIVPPGFPAQDIDFSGATIRLDPAEEYVDLPVAITRELLEGGRSFAYPAVRIEYRARSVIPMLPDDRMNRWSSIDRVEPERSHFVILKADLESLLKRFLELRSPGARPATRIKCPPGWVAYRDVVVTNSNPNVPDSLLPLVPRVDALPLLEGGLRVVSGSQRIYLTGGEPDVIVAGVRGQTLEVEVGGAVIAEVDSAGAIVPLVDSLAVGRHQVRVGSTVHGVEIVDLLLESPRPPVLAHHISRRALGWCSEGPARECDPSRDVLLSGAAIQIREAAGFSWDDAPPRMLKFTAGQETIAIGPAREVCALDVRQPEWTRQLGLPFNSVEVEALLGAIPFGPVWILRIFRQHYEVVPIAEWPESPPVPDPREWEDLVARLSDLRCQAPTARTRDSWSAFVRLDA